jgi:hypothetical protein
MKIKRSLIVLCVSILIFPLYSFDTNYSVKKYSEISNKKMIPEGSTLLASRRYKGVYWTLNDSGNPPYIFAVDEKGKIIKPSWTKKYQGIHIVDAVDIDWEAMCYDSDGNLIIEDAGNNYNYRTDLALYKIAEPNPYLTKKQGIIAKYPFKYPDQVKYPDENNLNFDCESVFSFKGKIHIITKNRSNTVAKLYRFNELNPWQMNVPEKIDEFDFKSMVTDVAISRDETKLLVLTYNYIWLFEIDKNQYNPFNTDKIYRKKVSLGQCEGVAFSDNQHFLITNEEGDIFKFSIDDIKK